jgi:hypothetical protein
MKNIIPIIVMIISTVCFSQKKDILIKSDETNKIYLVQNKSSKLYDKLSNFSDFDVVFDEKDKTNGVNSKWLKVEKYKNNYVLYAPCDWINERKMIIENYHLKIKHGEIEKYNLIKHGNLGKNSFYAEYETDSVSKNKFSFIAKVIHEKPLVYEFEFSTNNSKWKENYSKVDHIKDFDIIYNECKAIKADEFEF